MLLHGKPSTFTNATHGFRDNRVREAVDLPNVTV